MDFITEFIFHILALMSYPFRFFLKRERERRKKLWVKSKMAVVGLWILFFVSVLVDLGVIYFLWESDFINIFL